MERGRGREGGGGRLAAGRGRGGKKGCGNGKRKWGWRGFGNNGVCRGKFWKEKGFGRRSLVKDKIVHQIIDLVKAHQSLFDQVLREDISEADDLTLEQISLVVAILSKASILARWNDEYGFIQGLFGMMRGLFSVDIGAFSSIEPHENHKKSELILFRLSFSLCTYLFFLVAKKALRLQVSDAPGDYHTSGGGPQPTLSLLVSLLSSVRTALERVAEEKSLLLNKFYNLAKLSFVFRKFGSVDVADTLE
ncbi:nuclear pore complex protein NUP205 [Cinnamomum micranthum f. kanehirae]|uniref:Nuclear pore complex protein NUP205 n=1 Tax=Cinnamomum micranthum f. kanehirae TaxID=337451 RepID=A0A3S3NH79_9MAGN|nr:nuclear pore complex protein NUP205 [Cinnamomum micranthum f. kanehirae]